MCLINLLKNTEKAWNTRKVDLTNILWHLSKRSRKKWRFHSDRIIASSALVMKTIGSLSRNMAWTCMDMDARRWPDYRTLKSERILGFIIHMHSQATICIQYLIWDGVVSCFKQNCIDMSKVISRQSSIFPNPNVILWCNQPRSRHVGGKITGINHSPCQRFPRENGFWNVFTFSLMGLLDPKMPYIWY